jgi:hypothetical protein
MYNHPHQSYAAVTNFEETLDAPAPAPAAEEDIFMEEREPTDAATEPAEAHADCRAQMAPEKRATRARAGNPGAVAAALANRSVPAPPAMPAPTTPAPAPAPAAATKLGPSLSRNMSSVCARPYASSDAPRFPSG